MRLQRSEIAAANAWANPLAGAGKGERAICNWDEDAITLAVEAGRDAIRDLDRNAIRSVRLASTTLPFLDRLNSAVVVEALGLPPEVSAIDYAGSQRAATSALIQALQADETQLLVSAEKRDAKSGSVVELTAGDAGVAVVVGEGEALALPLAWHSVTLDFVDHYRTASSGGDSFWEERWIRDAGYMDAIPEAIAETLRKAGVAASEIAHFCAPMADQRAASQIARKVGMASDALRDSLAATCGHAGAAHPMLMLASALEAAMPGDKILAVGFGQGVDVVLFEATADVARPSGRTGLRGSLARRREERNYHRFLAINDVADFDRGMRAEQDKLTPMSVQWRNRDAITGFFGGKCAACGTAQFPKSRICVNPDCGAIDTQEREPFADKVGTVNSYTADNLTYTPDPPACYGMIQFPGGGRWMMDFADVRQEDLSVGMTMKMAFRIKDIDRQRGYRRYFWKAVPEHMGVA
ncbi:MAG: OB-fold domain-containing protein [Sphingomonas sp.]|uniref:3-oxoacyl-[acyl-carrier-protein] synthase III C-terminal domain-containing protein n=1 Tax=Sphingomonas sp. TaxID=28214 RepID=UPI0025F9FAC2|nr:3-oxoacyl-[acyl-carrier-protein] synthase III C-terminal domain-containing protein [Sphingomonas sp.]MBX3563525.1 OB-fold domain-containing protein [Sphingomonas sp.]